jgi:PAS domain S-box-containing protein
MDPEAAITVLWVGDRVPDGPAPFGDDTRVRTATAETVLDRIAALQPDCVVCADTGAGHDPLTVLRVVRDDYPHVPVVLSPETGDVAVASEATVAGVTAYLPRSVADDDRLADVIRSAVSKRRQDRRRQRRHERAETVVRASGDPVYSLDTDGNFTFVNDALAAMTGYTESELVGEHISIIMDADDVADGREHIRELLRDDDRDRDTFEMAVVTADGKRIAAENHIALLTEDGEFVGTTGIIRDISARQRRERELQRQNERLERITGALSHDIRSPLNVATGQADMLAREYDDDRFAVLETALDRIDDMLDDVLSLTRQGEWVRESGRVDIETAARKAWETSVTAPHATLVVDNSGTIEADDHRVRELLENLFRNAVEHNDGPITVRVGRFNDGFYVEDDGRGIPADEREQVLEMGYTDATDGTGFGLSIVDGIADAHGWDVRVTASDDGGARFELLTGQ